MEIMINLKRLIKKPLSYLLLLTLAGCNKKSNLSEMKQSVSSSDQAGPSFSDLGDLASIGHNSIPRQSIGINKLRDRIRRLSDDVHIDAYTRTLDPQIWNALLDSTCENISTIIFLIADVRFQYNSVKEMGIFISQLLEYLENIKEKIYLFSDCINSYDHLIQCRPMEEREAKYMSPDTKAFYKTRHKDISRLGNIITFPKQVVESLDNNINALQKLIKDKDHKQLLSQLKPNDQCDIQDVITDLTIIPRMANLLHVKIIDMNAKEAVLY